MSVYECVGMIDRAGGAPVACSGTGRLGGARPQIDVRGAEGMWVADSRAIRCTALGLDDISPDG